MPIIFQGLYGSVRVDLPLTATNAATRTSVFIQQERARVPGSLRLLGILHSRFVWIKRGLAWMSI
jgi:hypothetical protein